MPNWRSLKRMQRPDRLRIGRRLEWAYHITELLDQYVELPPVNLPDVSFDFAEDDGERIEDIADALREYWGLGFGPITDLAPILEYNGIVLIEEKVACEDMDAVSRWQGGRPFILYATEVESAPRKLFNLAHELGHIVLHTSLEVNSRVLDRMEKQANRFAGAFLLPRRTFSREVANTSVDYLLSLKGRWRVAVAAMVYRCKELGILNPYQVKYIWKQMNARNIRKREPLDTAFSLSQPSVLSSAIEMLAQSSLRTPNEIVDELAINPADIESLTALPPGALQNKVVSLHLNER
jgi:Zn-dependent peptidase ImmA (M78 family)